MCSSDLNSKERWLAASDLCQGLDFLSILAVGLRYFLSPISGDYQKFNQLWRQVCLIHNADSTHDPVLRTNIGYTSRRLNTRNRNSSPPSGPPSTEIESLRDSGVPISQQCSCEVRRGLDGSGRDMCSDATNTINHIL